MLGTVTDRGYPCLPLLKHPCSRYTPMFPGRWPQTRRDSMSLIDELRSVKSRVADRLRELEPLVAEYNELVKEAERLGIDTTEEARAAPTTSAPPAPAGRPGRGRS